jgi:hypothetical protein
MRTPSRSAWTLLVAVGAALVPLALSPLLDGCSSSSGPIDGGVTFDLARVGAVAIAPADTLTSCLALDAKSVYWADAQGGGAILSVPKTGGVVTTLFQGAVDPRGCVTIDSQFVYFTTDDAQTIRKVPIAGGAATTLASGQNVIGPLVAADGALFWGSDVYGNVDAYNGKNAILRLSTSGTNQKPSVEFAEATGDLSGLEVTSDRLFVSDATGLYSVSRASKQKGASFGEGTFKNSVFDVDFDGNILVMTEVTSFGMGKLVSYKLDGMGRQVISTQLASTLRVDSSGIYGKQENALVRFPLQGGAPVTLSSTPPRAIALDASSIFYTDGSAILKLPKTGG